MNWKRLALLTIALSLFALLGNRTRAPRNTAAETPAIVAPGHPTPGLTTSEQPDASPSPPRHSITSDEAVLAAVNQWRHRIDAPGFELDHPLHTATFDHEGVRFRPRGSAFDWHWRLRYFGTVEQSFIEEAPSVAPGTSGPRTLEFDHGAFSEEYVARLDHVEQRFILRQPPILDEGEDLLIRGEVKSSGTFQTHTQCGWVWRDTDSGKVVSLGKVTVFDADGTKLPASMDATPTETAITVPREALLAAAYPVTVDPEIGRRLQPFRPRVPRRLAIGSPRGDLGPASRRRHRRSVGLTLQDQRPDSESLSDRPSRGRLRRR